MSTSNKHAPQVTASTLIRRPPAEVFAAFIDPVHTTKFWFSKSSGPLSPGAEAHWEWEMYGAQASVRVAEFQEAERLVVDWTGTDGLRTEFRFVPHADGTVVTAIESGFTGTAEEAIAYAIDSTGGYTTALCGAKALLEHGLELGAVRDKFPDAWVQ
ncbi:uncharacterized protein YndB with AHSA1/START domain [Tamaricihabitans halophyticus]|uniref:Uncharacterized protein YndB with AHSA1/START domain n=1 Tax=Tamaricihabitans halophyticus TaxID=1262583 RepID=A0A4R2R1G6_9PSEU|nr:SRPBCC domain-containing protein [Tamaricihabitans halophyticus]TCP56343.1 uncharacterized protein YndB with AHSA1/START domain [Tamaricihabitans halophyticus]